MRYEAECKKIAGIKDCAFVAGAHTLEELKTILFTHGMSQHADIMQALSDADRKALEAKIESTVAGQDEEQS